ncbi:MAG: transglycosylase domain-containing protein, partial [Treponema sp.]
MRILRFSAKVFWVSALISLPILIFLYYALSPFPELKSFEKRNYSVQFYDRNERLIYVTALDGGLRREFIPYENIPEHVKKAFIRSEDRRFFFHRGIDLQAIFRAAFQNIIGKRTVSGASTITM